MRVLDCHPQANGVAKRAGRSAAAKHAYISRLGQYSRHSDRALAIGSIGMPDFAADDAAAFWAAADQFERANATIAFEYVFPLPGGLTEQQQVVLCADYARQMSEVSRDGKTVPVSWALHQHGRGENPHMHLLVSERVVDERTRVLPADRFFRRFNSKEPDRGGAQKRNALFKKLDALKSDWCKLANKASREARTGIWLTSETLIQQRERSLKGYRWAKSKGYRGQAAAYLWWNIKTYRPTTSHLGRTARSAPEESKERRDRYATERAVRDAWLHDTAVVFLDVCKSRSYPIPTEVAELLKIGPTEPRTEPQMKIEALEALLGQVEKSTKEFEAPALPKDVPVDSSLDTADVTQVRMRRDRKGQPPFGENTILEMAEHKIAFKASLWQQMSGVPLTSEAYRAAAGVAFIDRRKKTIRTRDGALVRDLEAELRATRATEQALALMIVEAKNRGWREVEIDGLPDEDRGWVVAALAVAGIKTSFPDDEARAYIERQRAAQEASGQATRPAPKPTPVADPALAALPEFDPDWRPKLR